MIRGVPLDDPLRTRRLTEWYWEEKKSEMARTMVLIAASMGSDKMQDVWNKYVQSIFPTGKMNEEFLKTGKEILDMEVQKNGYQVQRTMRPGEDY